MAAALPFGPGESNERGGRHDNPRVIPAWAYATVGNLAELQPPITPHGRPSVLRLTELLEQPARICARPQTLPVWHCSIHNHPDDPILTDQQWEHVATEITAAVGLAPHGDLDAIRWILPKPNQEPKSPFRSEEYLDGLGSRVDCEVWRRRLGRRPVGGDQHVGVADFRGDTVGVMAS